MSGLNLNSRIAYLAAGGFSKNLGVLSPNYSDIQIIIEKL
jgi:hypothetical protein